MKRFSISINTLPPAAGTNLQVGWVEAGPLGTNGYLVWDPQTRDALMIDPGAPSAEVEACLRENRLALKTIVNTHGHADHIGGNAALKKSTGAAIWIHAGDQRMLTNPAANLSLGLGWPVLSPPADVLIDSLTTLKVGEAVFRFLETPGHTRGSVCLWTGDALFSGDTLFAGSAGRTDLPGGNYPEILHSLHQLQSKLPEKLRVYPGHGGATTLAHEIQHNPFFKEASNDENT
jgi:glyoxylase-like metal-dependent hydrolase (beta-lactamase superfamily II)